MSKRVLLPKAVKAIREAKAATDDEFRLGRFAIAAQMTPGHLCNIEAGRKPATEAVIHRLAALLRVDVDAISFVLTDSGALAA